MQLHGHLLTDARQGLSRNYKKKKTDLRPLAFGVDVALFSKRKQPEELWHMISTW